MSLLRPIRVLWLMLLMAASASLYALPDRCVLYADFLEEQMDSWGEVLAECRFAESSDADKRALLELEYGYTAYAVQFLKPDSGKYCLDRFLSHLESSRGLLSEADYWAYLSAAESYALKLDESAVLTHGVRIFRYAKRALEADPNAVAALMVNANICFYAPRVAGGNKRKAMQYYQCAVDHYRAVGDTICNWQYHDALFNIDKCRSYLKY